MRSIRGSFPARLLGAALAVVLGLAGLSGCGAPPTLSVRVVASNLTNPWDLAFTPLGSMFFTQRAGGISLRTTQVVPLGAELSDLFAEGETGLMGIAVHPGFNFNRRIYTCQGYQSGSYRDIRVVPWTLSAGSTTLARLAPIVTRIPVSSGRHGGCRLRFAPDGRLWIGTGDAAVGTNPQSLTSLGGKILRVDAVTGEGVSGNPFIGSANGDTQRIWSYGHRNVQGLALRPSDGVMWTVEHGPDRDDEINRGIIGNFGWDPVPGYNEATPMTDRGKFPGAIGAAWSSGNPTVATSGATWLSGPWKGWNDTLAVAALKDQSLRIMRPSADGLTLTVVDTIFRGTFGRLRTAQLGPGGRLYLTTSNGGGTDQILEVTPS